MAHTLVYGGTFDPIHFGHLITCQRAREQLKADRVLLIPAGISPHKQGRSTGATGEQRLAMISRAISGIPYFAVDGREVEREGPSYTADTLDELGREKPGEKLTLLMGGDQLSKFHSWYRVRDILRMAGEGGGARDIAILGRTGAWKIAAAMAEVSSHLGQSVADRLVKAMLSTPLIEISATEVRERVKAGLPINFLVPHAVEEYIEAHGLYR